MTSVDRKGFRRVLLELVVIVGGVLIALWIDAGWGWWQDRQEEAQILADLETDFAANLATIDTVLSIHQQLVHWIPVVSASGAEGVPDAQLQDVLYAITTNETFRPRRGALDAAIASGRLNLIRDASLRSALTGWGRFVLEAQEEIEWAVPFNHEFLGATAIDFGGLAADQEVADFSDFRPDPTLTRALLNRVRDEVALQRSLHGKWLWTTEGLTDMEALRTETERVLELTRRSLARAL